MPWLDRNSKMNSMHKECNELKQKYDACYTVWFTDRFLKGDTNEEIENYPMESCRQLKEQYEACFNVWFPEKFLKGDNNDSMCKELLKSYTDCVQKNMREHNISIKEIENDNFEVEKNAKPQSSSGSK